MVRGLQTAILWRRLPAPARVGGEGVVRWRAGRGSRTRVRRASHARLPRLGRSSGGGEGDPDHAVGEVGHGAHAVQAELGGETSQFPVGLVQQCGLVPFFEFFEFYSSPHL